MSHRQRLDRLERQWGAGRCPVCAVPLGGPVHFAMGEEAGTGEPVEPCPRCHQPVTFMPDLGSAVEDDR